MEETVSIQCRNTNTVCAVMQVPNKGQCILLGGCEARGEWLEMCPIQECIALKATQEGKFELVGTFSYLLYDLSICRRNVIRNNQEKNVWFLLVYFCHFFGLSKPIGARE